MVVSRLEACKGLWECGGVGWEGILGSPYLGGACGLGLYLGKAGGQKNKSYFQVGGEA